jgi:hypothetical protein
MTENSGRTFDQVAPAHHLVGAIGLNRLASIRLGRAEARSSGVSDSGFDGLTRFQRVLEPSARSAGQDTAQSPEFSLPKIAHRAV